MPIPVGKKAKIPEAWCYNCGSMFDSVSGVGKDAYPREGAITICTKCGYLMAFDRHMQLRDLNQQELLRVAGDRRMEAIQLAIQLAKK